MTAQIGRDFRTCVVRRNRLVPASFYGESIGKISDEVSGVQTKTEISHHHHSSLVSCLDFSVLMTFNHNSEYIGCIYKVMYILKV